MFERGMKVLDLNDLSWLILVRKMDYGRTWLAYSYAFEDMSFIIPEYEHYEVFGYGKRIK